MKHRITRKTKGSESPQINTFAPRSRQITTPTPHHSNFYRPDALPDAQPCQNIEGTFILYYTHTHSFNSPLSGTTRVSQYQKGKINLYFTEARDSEWQWHPPGHMQVCTSLQSDNHASNPPLSFLQAGCPSCRPTNSVKALNVNKTCTKQAQNFTATIHSNHVVKPHRTDRVHRCYQLLSMFHGLCLWVSWT